MTPILLSDELINICKTVKEVIDEHLGLITVVFNHIYDEETMLVWRTQSASPCLRVVLSPCV